MPAIHSAYEIQYGLPSVARRGDRLLGERERLVDAAGRLEAVDVRRRGRSPRSLP